MPREDHQPLAQPAPRPDRSLEQMRAVCSQTVALVLATQTSTASVVVVPDDPDSAPETCVAERDGEKLARPLQLYRGQPCVVHAVRSACRAQVSAVYVLAASPIARGVAEAVDAMKRRKVDPDVHVLETDVQALLERTRASGDVELFDLGFGVLEIARALAGEGFGRARNVAIMRADMVRISEDHLFELCEDMNAHPGTQVVASWIQWLRRPPYVLSADFLDELASEAQHRAALDADAPRPVPRFAVRDHVFGEEKLASGDPVPESVEAMFGDAPIAALQAVSVAEYAQEHPGEPLHAPDQPQALMGKVAPEPLKGTGRALVDAVTAVRARAKLCGAGQADELAWADAFGRRNRADFPLLNDRAHAGRLAYLDTAATAQRVDVALQAQRDFDEHENANVYRGGYPLSSQATFTYNDARKTLEDFIGAEKRSTVFTANTTAAVNLVAQAWGEHAIGEGDLIVTTLAAHHANMLPFLMLAQRKGARVEHVPYGPDGRIDQAAFARLLEQGPKLVAVEHVGNVFGIREPVEQMARAAHDADARVLVDAAQSFAHLPIDVKQLGADWLAFSAHKAYGPMGLGGLWIGQDAFQEMDPVAGGGGVVSHVGEQSYYLRPASIQYEPGTPPVSQAVGFAAAIGYLQALGMGNIARHDTALTRYVAENLARIDGVTVVGDHSRADGQVGLVSFTVRSVAPAQLAAFLGKLGVAIRSGGHCALPLHAALGRIGTGRISIGVYTTRADVDAALAAVELCRSAYEKL